MKLDSPSTDLEALYRKLRKWGFRLLPPGFVVLDGKVKPAETAVRGRGPEDLGHDALLKFYEDAFAAITATAIRHDLIDEQRKRKTEEKYEARVAAELAADIEARDEHNVAARLEEREQERLLREHIAAIAADTDDPLALALLLRGEEMYEALDGDLKRSKVAKWLGVTVKELDNAQARLKRSLRKRQAPEKRRKGSSSHAT